MLGFMVWVVSSRMFSIMIGGIVGHSSTSVSTIITVVVMWVSFKGVSWCIEFIFMDLVVMSN